VAGPGQGVVGALDRFADGQLGGELIADLALPGAIRRLVYRVRGLVPARPRQAPPVNRQLSNRPLTWTADGRRTGETMAASLEQTGRTRFLAAAGRRCRGSGRDCAAASPGLVALGGPAALYACCSLRLGYGRGGLCGRRGRRRAWFPGRADQLHRPGRAAARGRGPAGAAPAGDGDRAGRGGQDPAGRAGGPAGGGPVRGRGVAGRAGAGTGPGARRGGGGSCAGDTGVRRPRT